MFQRGQIVRHQKWGLGKVLEISGPEKVRVQFQENRPPTLLGCAYLELVDAEPASQSFTTRFDFLQSQPTMDMSKVRAACETFVSRMEDRRTNCDDAGVAKNILKELESSTRLTLTTYKRLASWCHTDGSFREGVDLARTFLLQSMDVLFPLLMPVERP